MKWIVGFFILLLSGCGKSAPPPSTSLRLTFNAPPTTLDPRKSGDFLSSTLICMIYEGLTRCAPGGEIEPALAESWTISPDGRTYTFFLRPSFWSNGTPVTAYDFERTWKEIIDPSFSALSHYLFFPIKNAEKCVKGEIAIEEVAIQAIDAKTLRIELERPTPYFLSLTAFPLFLPTPSPEVNDPPILNGPFLIQSYEPNREIVLKKNRSFWNFDEIDLEEIHIQIIPDENTALQLFERGEIDWLGAPLAPIPPDALAILKEKIQFIPMDATTFLTFNTQAFPFQNETLRKALSLCIDQKSLIEDLGLSGQIPAERSLPPSLFPKPLPSLFETADGEKARALFEKALEELQIPLSDLQSLTLYFKPSQADKRVAQALQRIWQEVLGLEIRIEQLDPKSHLDRLHRREYQFALGSWIAQFHDPVNILERYRLSSNPKNFAGWEDSRFGKLLEKASEETNPADRMALLEQAEELFAQELPILPLYHWTSPTLVHPRIAEIAFTPSGGILFERFSLKEKI